MSKNKKNKKKQKQSRLSDMMVWNLKSTRLKAESTIKECEALIKKIDSEGVAAYYSENSDVLRHAIDVWRGCIRAAELRKINEDMK
tara:strand:+ start:1556 stop:1813 length:258 start_codon:yes stop_codon:yes gene_type:complete